MDEKHEALREKERERQSIEQRRMEHRKTMRATRLTRIADERGSLLPGLPVGLGDSLAGSLDLAGGGIPSSLLGATMGKSLLVTGGGGPGGGSGGSGGGSEGPGGGSGGATGGLPDCLVSETLHIPGGMESLQIPGLSGGFGMRGTASAARGSAARGSALSAISIPEELEKEEEKIRQKNEEERKKKLMEKEFGIIGAVMRLCLLNKVMHCNARREIIKVTPALLEENKVVFEPWFKYCRTHRVKFEELSYDQQLLALTERFYTREQMVNEAAAESRKYEEARELRESTLNCVHFIVFYM